jgi:orotate phosphoribosyltransferase
MSRPYDIHLDILRLLGGYYCCPKDENGKRLGPLVPYAGRDEQGRQYVGDEYANFAKAERRIPVLRSFAEPLSVQIRKVLNRVVGGYEYLGGGYCGAPLGGNALAEMLADIHKRGYIFPEKKVVALPTETSREKAELVWGRHEPEEHEGWVIVEDVCNNFSTTLEMVNLIESRGAQVLAIACFLNRSTKVDTVYSPRPGLELPVIALVRRRMNEWQQDHPYVADDVKSGNVVWKPKNEWSKLADAMAAHPAS